MKVAPALILITAIGITLILIFMGLAGIAFGVLASAMGGGGWLVFAALGLIALGCGIGFALKVVVPAWQLTKGDG